MLNEKKRKYLLLLLSIVIIVVYSAIYWNRVIPFTDGWGIYYAELMKTGKYPYRDFYVYLPPLNLVIDSILWKLSFGYFIIYRLYRVAERIILLTLIYKLLNKVVNPEISAIASVAGVLYVSLTNFDLLGDYNQTANVVLVLMTMILLKIVSDKNISNKKYLFFLGVMIGISFLLKQTVFVASGLFLFVFLTMI
ncbi:glycosyltransferase family 39 protein, partial [Roseburia inulinivorans]